MKAPNAFTIPAKSGIMEKDRRAFRSPRRNLNQKLNPITLPGGSPYLKPAMQLLRKETT